MLVFLQVLRMTPEVERVLDAFVEVLRPKTAISSASDERIDGCRTQEDRER